MDHHAARRSPDSNDNGTKASSSQDSTPEQPPTRTGLGESSLRLVAADGSRVNNDQDPPGQYCVYIPPGDVDDETYRRATFAKFPNDVPVNVADFPKSGFYYTGFEDRVKCSGCGVSVDSWKAEDGPADLRWHHSSCRVVNRVEGAIAFSASTGLNTSLFRMVAGMSPLNIPVTEVQGEVADPEDQQRIPLMGPNRSFEEPPDPSRVEKVQLHQDFPCNHPFNPEMASLEIRTESFRTWPRNEIRAPPEQLARAGLYFLGEGDMTKCYYCDGRLQNWDQNDEPWTEHAKWFPRCEYVLSHKGIEFVRQLEEAHPNLNRPSIRNPATLPHRPRHASSNFSRLREHEVAEINRMGFDEKKIETAMQTLTARGEDSTDCEKVIELLLHVEPEEEDEMDDKEGTSTQRQPLGKRMGGGLLDSPPSEKRRRMGEDREDMIAPIHNACRKCKKSKADVVLIPCGHLCLCQPCSSSVHRCPICDSAVQKCMKVFRA